MTLAASPTEKTRDDRLAIVLDALQKQQAAGKPIDFDALGREHPDLVDEIKQLLAVGQMIDFVNLKSTNATTIGQPGPHVPANTVQLPSSFGAYELLEEIGRGGMGIVYKAWDKTLERHVALKMILRGIHATPADLGRFRSEAQAAGGLTHPNIVPVYQVGEQDGQAYFCMKYVVGRTLAAVMADKPLHPREAARYMVAIARAVQHAHEKGILHRDLKPSNILIDENDQPLVTDFGLAKRVAGGESLTGTGAIVGTPSYMAPEQAEGTKNPTTACDVYSLGAILYELLTGRPPFLAASAVETLLLVRSEEPVRPRAQPADRCRSRIHLPQMPGETARTSLCQREEAGRRSRSVLRRRTGVGPVEQPRLFLQPALARVASRAGAGELGLALDVAQLDDFYALRRHQRDALRRQRGILAAHARTLAVHGAVEHRTARLGRVLLEPAAARRAGDLRRTANRARLGSGGDRLDRHLRRRDPAQLARADLDADTGDRGGHGIPGEGGHAIGLVLHRGGTVLSGAVPMAYLGPTWNPLLFGAISAVSFFVPGLKYYRQRLRSRGE